MDTDIVKLFERAFAPKDRSDTDLRSLTEDASRLWNRIQALLKNGLISVKIEEEVVKLACLMLQLPDRNHKSNGNGKPHRSTFKDRVQKAIDYLVTAETRNAATAEAALRNRRSNIQSDASDITMELFHPTAKLLRQLLEKRPATDEAKLLLDAINLDDFGISGLILYAMNQAKNHGGLSKVNEGFSKRDQYGYWEVMLKDGFHFEYVRRIAQHRLEHARQMAALLADEIREDHLL